MSRQAGRTVLRSVRPWGAQLSDVVIEDGVIRAIRPAADPGSGAVSDEAMPSDDALVVDGDGSLVLPSFSDVHAHLDSTRLGLPFRPHSAPPGLVGLIENDRENWRLAEEDVATRATRTLGITIASGATLVRSHAQVDTRSQLDRLEGVLAAKEAHANRARVEVVAFPQAGIVRDPGTADLLGAAVAAGADLVGGIDPCGLDRDPVRHLDVVFGLADRFGVGVDLHLHEAGELGAFTLELIIERVKSLGMQGKVNVSHAFALATSSAERVAELVAALAELDISLTTIAPSGQRTLPGDLLAQSGIRVGLGQDGMRDYWSPFGDGDLLGRIWQLAFVQQLRRDDLIERCVAWGSLGGRCVVDPHGGHPAWTTPSAQAPGIRPGDPGDLVVLPGETVTSAVMDRPCQRVVMYRGRVVAIDGDLVDGL